MLRESADDYLTAQVNREEQKGRTGQPRFRNRQQWGEIADLGWLGLALPESHGGLGMGVDAAASLCEVAGRHLFPEPYIAGALLPALILGESSTDIAVNYAAGLASAKGYFCFAWQEQTGEADTTNYGTCFDFQTRQLRGRKRFVCGLENDGIILVAARAKEGTVIIPVEAKAKGVEVIYRATAQGHYAEVVFSDVVVAEKPILVGAEADRAIASAIAAGRVAVAAQLTGIARGCLNATTDFVAQRSQFDRTLSSFQSVAHRCADMLVGVELSESVYLHAAAEFSNYDNPTECPAVYAAKARAGDVAIEVGRIAVQLHGAMGFTEECDIGLYLRAAMQYNSWLGAPTGLRREFLARSGQHELSAEVCGG